MSRAVTVGLGRIVEGRFLAQLSGPALGTARRADDFHSAGEPGLRPRLAKAVYNSGKILAARLEGTTL
jgi:hypothetical protein